MTANNTVIASTEDVDGCPGSGSLESTYNGVLDFGATSQCITTTIVSNTRYYFGFAYKQNGTNAMYCTLAFYPGGTCSGNSVAAVTPPQDDVTVGIWNHVSTSLFTDAAAGSAQISCQTQSGKPVYYDQFYLGTSPSDGY